MKEIKELLRHSIGLHDETVGATLIDHAIETRMREHGLSDPADYLKLLQHSALERGHLVESVIVKETWFFRDREPFRALVQLARHEWLAAHAAGLMRLLSIPCATGEEPYSMVMALLDAGVPANRFHIDALDLSPAAIAHAERGEYGRNSFRGKELDFRTRHFEPVGESYRLKDEARKPVCFRAANLLDDPLFVQAHKYDFIFCRNLLIYFDRETQDRVLHRLHHLLAPNGVLFLGSAEVAIATRNGFVSAHLPYSFACRKAPECPQRELPFGQTKETPTAAPEAIYLHRGFYPPETGSDDQLTNLVKARQLLDEGRMEQASVICENYLQRWGVSAEAYYLLGLARSSAGADSQAGEFYRKALYLDPNHRETLREWAELSQRMGDGEHARLLSERAARLQNHHHETS